MNTIYGVHAMRTKKGKKTLLEQVREIDPNLASSVYSLSNEELQSIIMQTIQQDEQLEEAKKNDIDLQRCKEQLSVALETYSVPLRSNKLKRKLILSILQERRKI